MIYIKSNEEIQIMRQAGRICAQAHEAVRNAVREGVSTMELSLMVEELIRAAGATPSFKGYQGFPEAACISVNDEIIHGIPSKRRILREGDIVSVDIGVCFRGFHGDAARTHGVGEISVEAAELIEVTRNSFRAGMDNAREGNRVQDVSRAVEAVAQAAGCGVVRSFVGHGVGRELHEDPEVPNYDNGHKGPRLYAGMTIAIEPMVNRGSDEVVTLDDGWTVVTRDGKWSAHHENTILVTKDDPIVLTAL
ncbi:MAG: type I methionyl aminopeptidase [Clostridiales bacterium]|jgi:methionyl aminopeptidase|nr:type I methionyl aminopeptidase [Clostridiales bacterium]